MDFHEVCKQEKYFQYFWCWWEGSCFWKLSSRYFPVLFPSYMVTQYHFPNYFDIVLKELCILEIVLALLLTMFLCCTVLKLDFYHCLVPNTMLLMVSYDESYIDYYLIRTSIPSYYSRSSYLHTFQSSLVIFHNPQWLLIIPWML